MAVSDLVVQRVTAGLSSEVGGGAAPTSVGVDFANSMSRNLPEGLLRKLSPAVTSVPEPAGATRALSDLSAYLTGRQHAVARMMDKAVRTGSPDQMLQVATALIDGGAETDLVAKTIGKTVSAVDQLTKLN